MFREKTETNADGQERNDDRMKRLPEAKCNCLEAIYRLQKEQRGGPGLYDPGLSRDRGSYGVGDAGWTGGCRFDRAERVWNGGSDSGGKADREEAV